jgi:arsenite-transporting ATPase
VVPSFQLVAGNGGVGKTTCAAAAALSLPRGHGRALIVSTDPAHSLGDALGVRLSPAPRRVVAGLDAVELDAPRAFARWLNHNRRALADVLEHGTWLDRSDVDALLDLTIPGIDELMGLLEISRLAAAGYRRIVVDTAPTGHTLRLLSAPATVEAVAGVLDALQEDHRIVKARFARTLKPEAADRLIALLAAQAHDLGAILRDPRRTTITWITLPERMSIAEAGDGVAALHSSGIAVPRIVVNRVLPDDDPCRLCDGRRAAERSALSQIRRELGRGRQIRVVHAALAEPRGVASLRRVVFEPLPSRLTTRARPLRPAPLARTPGRARSSFLSAESIAAAQNAELLFVGGKGGVGKTTVAAALAVRLARSMPARSVLLMSTDPAHSLGDVFAAALGDQPSTVRSAPPNLRVRELDAAVAFAAVRARLVAALDDVAGAGGLALARSRRLMDLAPPGIDELFGMVSVVDARAAHGLVVVDTAPTGHALRLLEMPEAARQWLQVLLRMLLKYKALVKPGRLAAELVDASRAIRDLQGVLRDSSRTRFLVVTRSAAVPRAETERLIRRLRRLRIAVPAVVVNAQTLDPGRCRRCQATARAERRELAALDRFVRRAGRRDCAIILTPLTAPPPRGAAALDRWAQRWQPSS